MLIASMAVIEVVGWLVGWLVGYILGHPGQLQSSWLPADSNAGSH
jgi:hypothetical protein